MGEMSLGDAPVAKCYGCGSWLRAYITEQFPTIAGSNTTSPQRWCYVCLSEIDDSTQQILRHFSGYPDGIQPWGQGEEDDDNNNETNEEN